MEKHTKIPVRKPSSVKTAGIKAVAPKGSGPKVQAPAVAAGRPRSDQPVAETLGAAAELLGIPKAALSWAKNVKACPAFRGPRVRIEEFKTWWAENGHEWTEEQAELPLEDILDRQIKVEKLDNIRREKEIAAGRYVLKSEVVSTLATIGAEQQSALLAMPRELAPRLPGLDAITIQQMLEAAVCRVIEIFQHGTAKWTQQPGEWFYEI